jgi:hypothetical protein
MHSEKFLMELQASLAARAEQVCRHLLPAGRRQGTRWVCGGVDGGPGKSMNVELEGDKAGVWHDHQSGESGRLLTLWQENQNVSFNDAVTAACAFCNMDADDGPPTDADRPISFVDYKFDPPPPPKLTRKKSDDGPPPVGTDFDWDACVAAMTEAQLKKLADWRGYSLEFCHHLHRSRMIGVFRGSYALPVHNEKGEVTRCHYRLDKGWAYYPPKGESAPLVIGSPEHARHTIVGESQWDIFAILDRIGHHDDPHDTAGIITRGANSNTDMAGQPCNRIIVVPQNDPADKASKSTGRTPAEEWTHKIQTQRGEFIEFTVSTVPKEYKDANDWIRAENPTRDEVWKRIITNAKNPALDGVRTLKDLLEFPVEDDPNSLIGYKRRFLGKGKSWVIIGPSGIGKSTLVSGFGIYASAGIPWHGIKFRRPLRTLMIQAENDEGDLSEMMRGTFTPKTARAEFAKEDYVRIQRNLLFKQITDLTGEAFVIELETLIRETKADLVLLDPLLSYIGGDISKQEVASHFFRNLMEPMLKRTGVIFVAVHHTGKPPKDSRAMKDWSDHDFSYLGLGSSELVNWARAVAVIIGTEEKGTYRFAITKRGKRAGMIDQFTGQKTNEIFVRWGNDETEGQTWQQTKRPDEEEKEPPAPKAKLRKAMAPTEYLEYLPQGEIPWSEGCKTISEIGNVSGNAARLIFSELVREKHIVRDGKTYRRA